MVVGQLDHILVLIRQSMPINIFHDVIGHPPAALHDVAVRDQDGMQGADHIMAVVMEAEGREAVGLEEAPVHVGQ